MGPKGAGWGRAVGILIKRRTITTYRTGYLKTPIGIPSLLYRVSTRGTHNSLILYKGGQCTVADGHNNGY